MNTKEQAKNGFKTFLLTFGISLLVFGFFYYLLSDPSVTDVSIEDGAKKSSNTLGMLTGSTEPAKPATQKTENVGPTVDSLQKSGPTIEERSPIPTPSAKPDVVKEDGGVLGAKTSSNDDASPFGSLTETKPDVPVRNVLQASDTTTTADTTTSTTDTTANTSTTTTATTANTNATTTTTAESTTPVPETGTFGITLSIVMSLSLLAFFVYILFLNPRNFALSKFEQDVMNDF